MPLSSLSSVTLWPDILTKGIESRKCYLLAQVRDSFPNESVEQIELRVLRLMQLGYALTPTDFEYFVAYYFHCQLGYEVVVSGRRPDGGIDIKGIKKNEITWEKEYLAVQCKRWNRAKVTLDDVRAMLFSLGKAKDQCCGSQFLGLCVTLNEFTKDAQTELESSNFQFSNWRWLSNFAIQEGCLREFEDWLKDRKEADFHYANFRRHAENISKAQRLELRRLLKKTRTASAKRYRLQNAHDVCRDDLLDMIATSVPFSRSEWLQVVDPKWYGAFADDFEQSITSWLRSIESTGKTSLSE